MKNTLSRSAGISVALAVFSGPLAAQESKVGLMTLDPGHFHAGLVQKFMYPEVSPQVHVYAPTGPDLEQHLKRIEGYNTRAENPTQWDLKVHSGPESLKQMLQEKPGNVVILSGNNARKTEYIHASVKAGLHVLADKPMAIDPAGFKLLCEAFKQAGKKKVLLYDIMTERSEITTMLQRELSQFPELFGKLEKGTLSDPAVTKESVHHYFKEVSGKPLVRPPWFYDVTQQGEAIPDVGTHLVDLVQWGCFPGEIIDYKKDIQVLAAKRWATSITPAQFKRSTGLDAYPEFLKPYAGQDGELKIHQNGETLYMLRGVHAKVSVIWNFEAPAGAKDTHYSLMRGTKASLIIRQGADQNYQATLYVANRSGAPAERFEGILRDVVGKVSATFPGIEVKPSGTEWMIVVPAKYNVGHEAHFGEVMERYLRYLAKGELPDWEVPNMIAKYYTTTEAYRISRKDSGKR